MVSFRDAFANCPLIAILRGLDPGKAVAVGQALVESGFCIIEVPLNSPEPLRSIELLSDHFGDDVLVGAGTVLTSGDVDRVASAGGRIIVAPNLDSAVGSAARSAGLTWCPGVMTPTEAFAALEQGADLLKIFPAELVPPAGVAAMRAVLPAAARIAVVGGISPETLSVYAQAGANGFGLGSGLFKPDFEIAEISERAGAYIGEFRRIRTGQ